jgi:sugar/nucleoside kinase (ribokinase family)
MKNFLNDQDQISFFFIGHIAIDEVIKDGRQNEPTLGGSVSYCSLSLKKYADNINLSIISNFNKSSSYNSLLKVFFNENINLEGITPSETNNTRFLLDYFNHSRNLILKSRCPDLQFSHIPEDILHKKPDVIVLVPLCNEISYDYISKMANTFPETYYGIDLQGFIREIDKKGQVSLVRNKQKIKNLHRIIDLLDNRLILKGSEEEMKILSGEQNWNKVMKYFQQYAGIFIMTLGDNGSMISKREEKILKIPAFQPKRVRDETGAGDVYLSIFLYEFISSSKSWKAVKNAGYLASSAASFEIEKRGVNGFAVKNEVQKRLKSKKYKNEL